MLRALDTLGAQKRQSRSSSILTFKIYKAPIKLKDAGVLGGDLRLTIWNFGWIRCENVSAVGIRNHQRIREGDQYFDSVAQYCINTD